MTNNEFTTTMGVTKLTLVRVGAVVRWMTTYGGIRACIILSQYNGFSNIRDDSRVCAV
jgi:hypothetical protein